MLKQPAPKPDIGAKARRKRKADDDKLGENEVDSSLSKLLKDRQAKKNNQKADPYATKRSALYDVARMNVKNMTNESISCLEEVQESILELKNQETTFRKYLEDLKLIHINEETAYEKSKTFDSKKCARLAEKAQEIALEQHSQQKSVLEDFSKEARRRLTAVRQEQQKLADASAVIKHYKALLRA
ncbi:hypothetical protein BJ165DRAFT_835626 [Panaeolus papilionaceus]|nr:hypothetical protein BJ165DRAFT_835626 [Panaeolus papilionaceus]